MTNFKTAFPSRYLKAEDLGTARPIVQIASVDFADVGAGPDVQRKILVMLDAANVGFATPPNANERAMVIDALEAKGWVLNRINAETVAEIAGSDDIETWAGHRVELFATKTEYQGKRVPCIRCQAPKWPKKPAAVPSPASVDRETDTPDDVPF